MSLSCSKGGDTDNGVTEMRKKGKKEAANLIVPNMIAVVVPTWEFNIGILQNLKN